MSEPQKVIDISTGSTSPESKQPFHLENPLPKTKRAKRTAKEPKPEPESNRLLNAVQFISVSQPKRSTNPAESHCRIFGKYISACAGVLSAGIQIQEDIECCPHTQKFLDALTECPDIINLTLLPTKELSIKSGNFHAIVPCIEQSELPPMYSDIPDLPVSIEFEQALQRVGKIANEHNRTVLYSSVQMLEGSIIATNGDVIMEAWHGCTTPFGLIVPKMFIKALHRTKGKAVYSLACSADTLTAYFPDRSWIKTKLHHDEHFPNLQGFLSLPVKLEPVPLGFWAAVERLAPFSNDDRIYLRKEGMCTDRYETDGAINICEGLPDGISFAISTLRLIHPFAEKIAFNVTRSMSYFQGHNIRGVIAQRPIQE